MAGGYSDATKKWLSVLRGQLGDSETCLQVVNPALAREWHKTRNGNLRPFDVRPSSGRKVWWECKKGHEWQAIIGSRIKGVGCPYCRNYYACKDNSLETNNSALAKEWHPTKNGSLTPANVTPGSNKRVWWQCRKGHEWRTTIAHRSAGQGCTACRVSARKEILVDRAKEWRRTMIQSHRQERQKILREAR